MQRMRDFAAMSAATWSSGEARVAMALEPRVHVLHEAVEMLSTLFADRQLSEELVHQECLAAADAAPEVKAAEGCALRARARPRPRQPLGRVRAQHGRRKASSACDCGAPAPGRARAGPRSTRCREVRVVPVTPSSSGRSRKWSSALAGSRARRCSRRAGRESLRARRARRSCRSSCAGCRRPARSSPARGAASCSRGSALGCARSARRRASRPSRRRTNSTTRTSSLPSPGRSTTLSTHFVELLDLAVDLGRADAHAAGIQHGVRAAVDDHAAVRGQLGVVAVAPDAGKALEVRRAVLARRRGRSRSRPASTETARVQTSSPFSPRSGRPSSSKTSTAMPRPRHCSSPR